MPIVWKTSFEEPLLRQMQSGTLGNSALLVNAIVTLYDLSIKQGFPNPPGTPAGPVVAGNRAALQAALTAFFLTEAIQAQAGVIKLYAGIITGIITTVKTTSKEISTATKQVNTAVRNQAKTALKIKQLSKLKTVDAKKQIATLKLQNAKDLTIIKDAKNLVNSKKQYLINQVRPQIKIIIDLLKKLIIKLYAPYLQDTLIKSIIALPKLIKDTFTDLKNKKKEFIDDIKKNVTKVKSSAETLKRAQRMVSKEDAATLKGTIVSFIKTTNASEMVKKGNQITGIVDKYPNDKIPAELKAKIRSSVTSVIQAKSQIVTKKQFAKEFLKEKLKERKDALIGAFKPKMGPGLSKAAQMKADALEIKQTVQNYKNLVKEASVVTTLLVQIKQEINILKRPNLKQYKPNAKLASALDKYKPGLGAKYLEVKNPKQAKTFIYTNTALLNAKKIEFTNKKEAAKGYIKSVKDKILKKKFNIKEIKFNIFLRIGLLGYWAGAATPNAGVVVFPGIVSLPVSMKPSANPDDFVKSLSKTFQAHIKTVAGTWTSPALGATFPWVGYS